MVPKPDNEILEEVSEAIWPACMCGIGGLRRAVDLVLWLIALSASSCVYLVCEADVVAVDFVGVDSHDGSW